MGMRIFLRIGPTCATSSALLMGQSSIAALLHTIMYVISHSAVGLHPSASVCMACALCVCQSVCACMYCDGSARKKRHGTLPRRHSCIACSVRMPD